MEKKLNKAKFKKKPYSTSQRKKLKTIFVSKVLSSNPSQIFEKFRRPVMVVKLKRTKILEKTAN